MLRATVNANDGTFTIPAEVPPAEEWLSVEEAAGNDIDVLRQAAESAINLIDPMAGRMPCGSNPSNSFCCWSTTTPWTEPRGAC